MDMMLIMVKSFFCLKVTTITTASQYDAKHKIKYTWGGINNDNISQGANVIN
jgi:hypothetical protein